MSPEQPPSREPTDSTRSSTLRIEGLSAEELSAIYSGNTEDALERFKATEPSVRDQLITEVQANVGSAIEALEIQNTATQDLLKDGASEMNEELLAASKSNIEKLTAFSDGLRELYEGEGEAANETKG